MIRRICQVFLLVSIILIIGCVATQDLVFNSNHLPAPWGNIKAYALSGELDGNTYIKIVQNNEKGFKYAMAYSRADESIAIHRVSQGGYLILVRMIDQGKVGYLIIDMITGRMWPLNETEACDAAFKCIRELVEGRLV